MVSVSKSNRLVMHLSVHAEVCVCVRMHVLVSACRESSGFVKMMLQLSREPI